ncbi:hypothetical protein Cadr_000013868 [Camelus dromedarius]|uniref:Uncharacterized protein n=1 Tax=Camelus dromedarius TaxID=9838 RepID=A0A5N4DE45_CAMDR|nr:hypothetical protein Cadr_000013868 [Camelus dromedarius]
MGTVSCLTQRGSRSTARGQIKSKAVFTCFSPCDGWRKIRRDQNMCVEGVAKPRSCPSVQGPHLGQEEELNWVRVRRSKADLRDTDRAHSSSRNPDSLGPRGGPGAACSHVSPWPGHSGPAGDSATCQLSARPGEPAALDAGPDCRGCVPGPGCDRLCCQPLLVPGRAGACEHGHACWKQSRWDPGRNRRQVLLDGSQLQVQ